MSDMKIAVVGSRTYENARKIKEFIYELKQRFGSNLTIISGGARTGADKYARKFALEMEIKYEEYNPAHTPPNLYSVMYRAYYSKTYHVSQFHHRNRLIATACDMLVAFTHSTGVSNGTVSVINFAKKFDKKVLIIT